jgi:hypothetical protein
MRYQKTQGSDDPHRKINLWITIVKWKKCLKNS